MVKVFALIPRRQDVTEAFFHEHWAGPHAELAKRITTMQRYVQSHRVDPGVPGLASAPYEGIAEVWFEDLATAAGMGEDPNYVNGCNADEPNFIDLDNLAFLMASLAVLREGEAVKQDAGGVKAMLLLARGSGLQPEGFAQALAEAGDRVAAAAPGARRVTVATALPEMYAEGAAPPCDAVVELFFDDDSAAEAGRVAAAVIAELRGIADDAHSTGFTAQELRVIWPSEAVTA